MAKGNFVAKLENFCSNIELVKEFLEYSGLRKHSLKLYQGNCKTNKWIVDREEEHVRIKMHYFIFSAFLNKHFVVDLIDFLNWERARNSF